MKLHGEILIEGWRCYVSGDELRHAESNGGFTMQVDKDGGIAGDNCYCPPAVVAWLFQTLHDRLGSQRRELEALRKVEKAAVEMRSWYDKQMGPDGPEEAFDAALAELRKVREDG